MTDVYKMRSYRILGVDPGQITGLFAVDVQSGPLAGFYLGDPPVTIECDIRPAQLTVEEVAGFVSDWLERNSWRHSDIPTLVAVEKYVITQRTARLSQQPAALEITGVVKHLCREAGVAITEQLKSNAAKLASDDRLKSLGWHAKGRPHHNDAARHALLALSSADPVLFEQLLTQGTINTRRNHEH